MKIISALIILVAFSLSACSSSPAAFPQGEFRDTSGRTITFMSGGTYTLYTSANNLAISEGSYSVEEDRLNLLYDNDFCFGIEGEYSWSLESDGSLKLDLLAEGCVGRAPPFNGSLTPVP